MTTRYPEHYIDEPTEEEYAELVARRSRAENDPLEGGQQLDWIGPQLEEDVIPTLDYPHNRSNSANPLRPLHSLLLHSQLGPSSTPWKLTLVEPLQSGRDHNSQVWRAQAENGLSSTLPVVVKLFQQSLFRFPLGRSSPEHDSWNWHSAAYRVEREAQAYRFARDLQGSDLPICYGFYCFYLPESKEEVVGVILEDLVQYERGIALDTFLVREARANRLTSELFRSIANVALRLQNALHNCDLALVSRRLDNLLYLRSPSSTGGPLLVAHGFSQTTAKDVDVELFLRAQETNERKYGSPQMSADYWCQNDQYALCNGLGDSLLDVGGLWNRMACDWAIDVEEEREKFAFLKLPW